MRRFRVFALPFIQDHFLDILDPVAGTLELEKPLGGVLMLELSEYREAIKLDEPWPVPGNDPRSNRELFEIALGGFTDEQKKMTDRQLFDELEAHLIERDAAPIPEKYGRAVNQLLYRKIALLGRTEAKHLKRISDLMPESDYSVAERTVLWRGDIRELVVDAVVEGASPDLQ